MSIYIPLKFCCAKFSMGDSIITHFMIYDRISTASTIRLIILQSAYYINLYSPQIFCAKFSVGDSIITHFMFYDRISTASIIILIFLLCACKYCEEMLWEIIGLIRWLMNNISLCDCLNEEIKRKSVFSGIRNSANRL